MFVVEVVHIVLQTVQRHGMCSALYGIVDYEDPLRTVDKTRPSVAMLP